MMDEAVAAAHVAPRGKSLALHAGRRIPRSFYLLRPGNMTESINRSMNL
jgi:hypothetical protein